MDFADTEQVAAVHLDLVHQYRELVVVKTVDDEVDDLHRNRHDINEVKKLCAQSFLMNDVTLWMGWMYPWTSQ